MLLTDNVFGVKIDDVFIPDTVRLPRICVAPEISISNPPAGEGTLKPKLSALKIIFNGTLFEL